MSISPKFYLKDSKAKEETPIYLGVKIHSKKLFKYYFSCKIYPELFDKSINGVTTNKKLIDEYAKIDVQLKSKLKVVTSKLKNIELDSARIIDELIRFNKEVKPELLKERLDAIYNSHRLTKFNAKSVTFNEYLGGFIAKCESGERLHNGLRYTKGTIKTYKTFLNLINGYNKSIEFNQVDLEFYKGFVRYLNMKNYSLNSVGKNIKFIKVLMKAAFEAGLHSNLSFSYNDFKSANEKVDSVYLTQAELDKLLRLELNSKPNYSIARDVFLVGCYTALRYSDYSRISKENIKNRNGYNVIEIITQKTKTPVIIPVKPIVFEILKRYDFNMPKTHEQKLNKYIKEVCRLAGIDELNEVKSTIGGEIKTFYKPKFELIKTHTARRTGATLLYLAGVPPIDIMKITGHTKESNLLKYICVTKEQTAERLAKSSFFI
ncbi:MAG: phage integrase SAM-like domain-containing protein [Bacteroidia bacterium]|nr:phage integrase SAM-like domain-containing protein [Bacteroidia bacterium]